jgi:hypothetical protein
MTHRTFVVASDEPEEEIRSSIQRVFKELCIKGSIGYLLPLPTKTKKGDFYRPPANEHSGTPFYYISFKDSSISLKNMQKLNFKYITTAQSCKLVNKRKSSKRIMQPKPTIANAYSLELDYLKEREQASHFQILYNAERKRVKELEAIESENSFFLNLYSNAVKEKMNYIVSGDLALPVD